MTEIQIDVDPANLPDTKERYVGWIDVMGTTAISSRSITEAAIKVFKLHSAAIAAEEEVPDEYEGSLTLYPMMDGIYVVASDKYGLMEFLQRTYSIIGHDVVDAEKDHHIFALRAAVAFGPVLAGKDMEGYDDRVEGTTHQDRTLVGLPVVQAFLSEDKAPPFGVYVHESARAFAPDDTNPFQFVWWKWFRSNNDEYNEEELAVEIHGVLKEYYEWSKNNSKRIGYEKERIQQHEDLVAQYFPEG